MGLLIGFLTVLMVLDCIALIFLVLIQLPKKEAGMGTAFGGGATDALFGAGSGNALTMITKYAAGIFLVLSLTLSILNAQKVRGGGIGKKLKETPAATAPASLPPPAAKTATPAPALVPEAPPLLTTAATNMPAASKK